jgi:hypothetical protein
MHQRAVTEIVVIEKRRARIGEPSGMRHVKTMGSAIERAHRISEPAAAI